MASLALDCACTVVTASPCTYACLCASSSLVYIYSTSSQGKRIPGTLEAKAVSNAKCSHAMRSAHSCDIFTPTPIEGEYLSLVSSLEAILTCLVKCIYQVLNCIRRSIESIWGVTTVYHRRVVYGVRSRRTDHLWCPIQGYDTVYPCILKSRHTMYLSICDRTGHHG